MNGIKKLFFVFVLLMFLKVNVSAQTENLSLLREANIGITNAANANPYWFHTNIRPYILSEVQLLEAPTDRDTSMPSSKKMALRNYINQGHLLGVDAGKFFIKADPVFSIIGGYDAQAKDKLMQSSIGFRTQVQLGKKLFAEVKMESINADYANYIDSVIELRQVVPGGDYAGKTALGYSSHLNSGYISYSPNRTFNFQAGFGKNFWGDGYRSLLLSDNSYSYPYFKTSAHFWRIKYISLLANFKDIQRDPGNSLTYRNKYATMHYLSWNALKWLNISLFEAIVFQNRQQGSYFPFDVNYLNPIIFYRPVEYSLGSGDNALMGASFKIKFPARIQLYGQVILDEFYLKEIKARKGWQDNKQGGQLGIKIFDIAGVKNLNFLTEVNVVRPYTYYHKNSLQNYGHYNQPLAHPYGANFYESMSTLNYKYNRWFVATKFIYAVVGLDSNATQSFGQDIYKPYNLRPNVYGNYIAQGLKTTLMFATLKASYLINSAYNLRIEGLIIPRVETNALHTKKNLIFQLGISTALDNRYLDF
ncbi:MAG: hypothetical protein IT238_11415 [Bacteroidia bacterium]|nr:hypothetical protein [Bacteroidia bacterium]MCZ2249450.1 hypothetical protein [Bacteroidia bacterium]